MNKSVDIQKLDLSTLLLKDCPFCGGRAEVSSFVLKNDNNIGTILSRCCVTMSERYDITVEYSKIDAIDKLIDRWNKRIK